MQIQIYCAVLLQLIFNPLLWFQHIERDVFLLRSSAPGQEIQNIAYPNKDCVTTNMNSGLINASS